MEVLLLHHDGRREWQLAETQEGKPSRCSTDDLCDEVLAHCERRLLEYLQLS